MSMSNGTRSDLTIEVGVREVNGEQRTMSQYRVPRNGKLVFRNAGKAVLVVTPKSGRPFCEADKCTELAEVRVIPGEETTVHICRNFMETEFLYTARVGDAVSEDPIVIIER